MAIIESNKLTKSYGKARGIIEMDLMVEEGDCFGFMGPNGAGKSTFIRTILGLIKPNGGSARVLGMDIYRQQTKILKECGYLPSIIQMKMNKTILIAVALLCSAATMSAQTTTLPKNDRISLTVGQNIPISNSADGDIVLNLNYSHTYQNGFGLKGGFQYSPSVADVDNAFGLPLAATYRTKSRQSKDRLYSGIQGVEGTMSWNSRYYDNSFRDILCSFLVNLFSDVEFSAGLTPGYIAGKSSVPGIGIWANGSDVSWKRHWTELVSPVSLTADLGITLNYSIGRVELYFTPVYHYSITGNYRIHVESGFGSTDSIPLSRNTHFLRSFATISGGLAFRF